MSDLRRPGRSPRRPARWAAPAALPRLPAGSPGRSQGTPRRHAVSDLRRPGRSQREPAWWSASAALPCLPPACRPAARRPASARRPGRGPGRRVRVARGVGAGVPDRGNRRLEHAVAAAGAGRAATRGRQPARRRPDPGQRATRAARRDARGPAGAGGAGPRRSRVCSSTMACPRCGPGSRTVARHSRPGSAPRFGRGCWCSWTVTRAPGPGRPRRSTATSGGPGRTCSPGQPPAGNCARSPRTTSAPCWTSCADTASRAPSSRCSRCSASPSATA